MSELNAQKPLVSVVMPTYNQARYIGESIESVLAQSYDKLELIIIDNHSNDDTAEIVGRYIQSDSRIHYIKFNNNGIIANSRNLGIAKSKGDYVAFVDSDDIWHSQKLEKQMALFDNSDVGIVYCSVSLIDSEGHCVSSKNISKCYRGFILPMLLVDEFSIANSSVVIRKSFLTDNNLTFRTDRQGAEDWDLWLRISEIAMADYIDDALVYYRIHQGAVSSNYKMMFNSFDITLNDFQKSLANKKEVGGVARVSLMDRCKQIRIVYIQKYANYLLGDGEYFDVLCAFVSIIKLDVLSLVAWRLLFKLMAYPLWNLLKKGRTLLVQS